MTPTVPILCAILFTINQCSSVDLPCDFSFESNKGFICRVYNFSNFESLAHVKHVIAKETNDVEQHFVKQPHISVTSLIMWNLDVHYLPGNLSTVFPYLKSLQVKKCGMKSLTRGEELHDLRKMFFGFNEIEHVPVNYFWHFCKLEILSLFRNKITSIPKLAFSDLRSLRRLSLNHNRIKSLDLKLFENCTNLEFVDLDNNVMELIGSTLFANLPKLSQINLRHNRLRFIGDGFLGSLPSIKVVNLKGNVCIEESFPGESMPGRDPLMYIQNQFYKKCFVPAAMTSTTRAPPKEPIRGKPKYEKRKPIYYFQNCNWQTPVDHRYF